MIKESFCILVHFFCLQFTSIGFSFKFIFGSVLFDEKWFGNYISEMQEFSILFLSQIKSSSVTVWDLSCHSSFLFPSFISRDV